MATAFNPSVNFVATKVRGEPVYEAVKPIAPDTELLVYYLPERPEELFFVRMRASLYRQTMDSILEGNTHLWVNVYLKAMLKRLTVFGLYGEPFTL